MEQLFDYFKNNPITVKQIRTYLKDKENLKLQLLQKYNDYKDRFSFLVYVRYMLLGIEDKKCLKCGKLLNNQQIRKDADYCSVQCANSSDYVKQNRKDAFVNKYGVQNPSQIAGINEKKKQSYLKHYGVQHPLQSQQVIQQIKQTNLQRYGVQFGLASKQIQQKSRKTVREKYGCQYISQSQDVKNKVKETNLQRYGTQFVLQNEEIKFKVKKTNLQRYGVQFATQNKEIKNKVKKTNLQRYGVQYSFFSKEIREKSKQTNLQRYGSENYFSSQQFLNRNRLDVYETLKQKFKNYVMPLFSKNEYIGYRYKQQYNWKCVKCGNQWKQHLHVSYHIDGKQTYIPRCLNCYPFTVFSKSQEQLFYYIRNICDNVVDKDRKTIYPYELDIYIPQKKVAFQFDGLYWHGQKIKDKNYHLMKTQKCLEKNIQLIHIFQDEWINKQDIVKDRIKNILGIYDNRIFARKCVIKEIKPSICNQFLDTNHIQGHDNSKIRLGLFYNDQLVSVMTFGKPRFNRNYEYELVRFASKLGTQVIGGAGKLLKYFQRKYNPKNIISYADRRYSNGNLYYALGFQFLSNSEPNYRWYKGFETYSRYQCQKHKLKQLLGQDKFNLQLSETQNMYLNGYNRIYDCGNMVFAKM